MRGTENISEIIELGKAIDYINNIRISNIKKNSQKLIKGLYEGLSEINDIILYGDSKNIWSIVSFNVKNISPHNISEILDEIVNTCVRSGFHCSISSLNHLKADYRNFIASIHCYNNSENIEKLLNNVRNNYIH